MHSLSCFQLLRGAINLNQNGNILKVQMETFRLIKVYEGISGQNHSNNCIKYNKTLGERI